MRENEHNQIHEEQEMQEMMQHVSRIHNKVVPDPALLRHVLVQLEHEEFGESVGGANVPAYSVVSPFSFIENFAQVRIAVPALLVLLLVSVAVFETTKTAHDPRLAMNTELPIGDTMSVAPEAMTMSAPVPEGGALVQGSPTMAMSAKMAANPVPQPSGDPDQIVAILLAEGDNDISVVADMTVDAAFVAQDSQVIHEYSNAYDETNF
jgi:hypothetical protein